MGRHFENQAFAKAETAFGFLKKQVPAKAEMHPGLRPENAINRGRDVPILFQSE